MSNRKIAKAKRMYNAFNKKWLKVTQDTILKSKRDKHVFSLLMKAANKLDRLVPLCKYDDSLATV